MLDLSGLETNESVVHTPVGRHTGPMRVKRRIDRGKQYHSKARMRLLDRKDLDAQHQYYGHTIRYGNRRAKKHLRKVQNVVRNPEVATTHPLCLILFDIERKASLLDDRS
jgi:hypothetical protein